MFKPHSVRQATSCCPAGCGTLSYVSGTMSDCMLPGPTIKITDWTTALWASTRKCFPLEEVAWSWCPFIAIEILSYFGHQDGHRAVPSTFLVGLEHHIKHLLSEIFRSLEHSSFPTSQKGPWFQEVAPAPPASWCQRPVTVMTPSPQERQILLLGFCLESLPQQRGDKLPFPGPSRSHLTGSTPQSCAVNGSKASRESQLKGPLGSAWVGTPMEHSFLNMGTARTISPRCPQVTEANGRVPAVLGQWIGMCLVNHYQEGLIAASLAALQGLEGEISLLKSVLHIWVGFFF